VTTTEAKPKKTIDPKAMAAFSAEWTALEVQSKALDYDRAALVRKWAPKLGGLEAMSNAMLDLGMVGPPRLGKILKQVATLEVIQDRKTWIALGWPWVSRLASVEDATLRVRLEGELRGQAALKGGTLSDKAIKDVLAESGGEILIPQTGKRDKPEADIFLAELRRLVRSKILRPDQVDPYVRNAAGLDDLADLAK